MKRETMVFIGIFVSISFIVFTNFNYFYPVFLDDLDNIFAFMAVLTYILTLIPSLLKIVFKLKNNLFNNWLFKYRRHIGVAAFGFAVYHSVLIIHLTDLMNPSKCFHFITGLLLLLILGILTFTSNNWSVKYLKKN